MKSSISSSEKQELAAEAGVAESYGLLILRLALGIIFMAHGAQKMFGWFGGPGLSGTVDMFNKMGIPGFLAYVVAFVEFFGGLAVFFGVLARLAAFALAINMTVAILKVHLPNGFFIAQKPGFEYPFALLAMSLLLLLAGPGRFALFDWESRLLHHSKNPPTAG